MKKWASDEDDNTALWTEHPVQLDAGNFNNDIFAENVGILVFRFD
jgi:hypothetical protein